MRRRRRRRADSTANFDNIQLMKKILTKLRNFLLHYFTVEQWNIGIIEQPIVELFRNKFNNLKIIWLKSPWRSKFHADQFGFSLKNRNYIIFEEYCYLRRVGRIALAELTADFKLQNFKIILDNGKHFSYPYVISTEENEAGSLVYFVCESHKTRELPLFKIEFDLSGNYQKITKIRNLLADKTEQIIDATPLFYQNNYWMFYTTQEKGDGYLEIRYSQGVSAEALIKDEQSFVRHPANPVKNDISCARPGGTPFLVDGELYRPAQNCRETYGGSIVINKITKLNQKEFAESRVCEIKPDPNSKYNLGLHNLSELGPLTLIDGKRRIIVFYKPLIPIIRNFLKLCKKVSF